MDERPVSLESAAAHAVECFKGLCERVVRMRETLDRSVPREAMERQCARLQRQIDESHAALRRRNARMAEVSTERDELRAEVASMRKRLMPEGMEWPKVDGEPVDFKTAYEPSLGVLEAVSIYNNGACEVMSHDGIVKNATEIHVFKPKVLDADGVEIKPGDTVCGTRDMEPMRVVDTDSDECGFKKIKCEKEGDGFWFYCPDELTHKLPVLAADGEPLEVGQTVYHTDTGREYQIHSINDDGKGAFVYNNSLGQDAAGLHLCPVGNLTHQRPVLDADGAPIHEGDTVWGTTGQRYTVTALCEYEPSIVHVRFEGGAENIGDELISDSPSINSANVDASKLTHTKPEPPDSIEKVASDLMKMAEVWCSKPLLKDAQSCAAAQVGESTLGDALKSVSRRCGALAERGGR